jgi:hypothetical protein
VQGSEWVNDQIIGPRLVVRTLVVPTRQQRQEPVDSSLDHRVVLGIAELAPAPTPQRCVERLLAWTWHEDDDAG